MTTCHMTMQASSLPYSFFPNSKSNEADTLHRLAPQQPVLLLISIGKDEFEAGDEPVVVRCEELL